MNWLTIKEAVNFTGKSESTLRKLSKKRHKGVKFETLPTGHKKILFSEDFLTIEFGSGNSSSNSSFNSSFNSSQENSAFELLREQLSVKDKQIEFLNERLKEAHILTANLENKLNLALPEQKKKRFLFW
jgi:hypothetical protein